jgi:hypothetical protein
MLAIVLVHRTSLIELGLTDAWTGLATRSIVQSIVRDYCLTANFYTILFSFTVRFARLPFVGSPGNMFPVGECPCPIRLNVRAVDPEGRQISIYEHMDNDNICTEHSSCDIYIGKQLKMNSFKGFTEKGQIDNNMYHIKKRFR